jgi:3-oxoacyl-[acyl-carrier protein] reductase
MTDAPSATLSADLSGQIALVTGAAQGLGLAIAIKLGANGAKVMCVDMNEEKLAAAAEAVREAGGEAEIFTCNVNDRPRVDEVVDSVVQKWDRLDILVNNAGITRDTLMPRMSDDEWDAVINTNLRGAFLFSRAASRYMMRARYGRIINMASISGIIGNPGQTNYSASKAGLIGMTRSLSRELAGRNVTINAVAPGFIESDMTKALGEAAIAEAAKRIPAKRFGTAEDVASAVLFLASRATPYITGQVVTVDGGLIG